MLRYGVQCVAHGLYWECGVSSPWRCGSLNYKVWCVCLSVSVEDIGREPGSMRIEVFKALSVRDWVFWLGSVMLLWISFGKCSVLNLFGPGVDNADV